MFFALIAAMVLTAAPDLKVSVLSKPAGAEVRLDDVVVGVTPLELAWPEGLKHTIIVGLAGGWSTAKKVIKKVKAGDQLSFVLVDLTLKAAQKKFDAAQARHDKEDTALAKLQRIQADKPSDELATKVEAAELAMQSAVEALEQAEEELANVKKARLMRAR